MSYIVYVGSFDPFHLGHLETAMKGLEYIEKNNISEVNKLVFVPNNPRKGKSDRSPLHRRLYYMSKLFPIYDNFACLDDDNDDKNTMIIDNRPVDIILNNIRDKNKENIGICGSDIVLLGKQPKLKPDRWIIFERNNLNISNNMNNFYDIPCNVIGSDKTKYQHISYII